MIWFAIFAWLYLAWTSEAMQPYVPHLRIRRVWDGGHVWLERPAKGPFRSRDAMPDGET